MKKVAKAILFAGIALVVFFFLGVLAINLYVQSTGVQEQICNALAEQLDRPVETGGGNFTPWGGLVLKDIRVRESAAPDSGLFIEAKGLRANVDFLSLFSRQIVVRDVALEEPKVTWRQTSSGHYQLGQESAPAATEWPRADNPKKSPPDDSAPPEPVPPPPKPARHVSSSAPPPKIDYHIEALHMHEGSFEFQDKKGARIVLLEGVEIACPTATADQVSGTARVATATFRSGITLTNLHAPFIYTPQELNIAPLQGEAANGRVDGKFRMQLQEPDSPYAIDLTFSKVDLDQLLIQGGLPGGQISGLAEGALTWQSDTEDSKHATGQGHLDLLKAEIRQYEFLAQLGEALQIDELRHLQLQEAQAQWHIADSKILVDQILLQSPNLKMTAQGKARFDGKLDLTARLTINSKVGRQLPEFIENNFLPVENSDQRYLDFGINGTAANPHTNLMQQILGQHLKEGVAGLLDGIFGTKKKPAKKEKKPPAPKDEEH